MNKICTSIEQSQKLIELGLSVNTADFMWEYNSDKETYWNTPTIIPIDDYIFVNDIPAWSLTALLNILAEQYFIIKSSERYNKYQYNIDIAIRHCKIWFPSLLDAAFEMVYWLKDNKKI